MVFGQVDVIHRRVDLTERLDDLHPVHQFFAGFFPVGIDHAYGSDLAVTGSGYNGQQHEVTDVFAGIVHSEEANHRIVHHDGSRHQAFDALGFQDLIGLRAGDMILRQGRNIKLPLFFKSLEPAFQTVNRNILKIIDLRGDPVAAPFKSIVKYRTLPVHLKNIGAIRVIISADVRKDAVQCLFILRLIQIVTQKTLDRPFLFRNISCKLVHNTPLQHRFFPQEHITVSLRTPMFDSAERMSCHFFA